MFFNSIIILILNIINIIKENDDFQLKYNKSIFKYYFFRFFLYYYYFYFFKMDKIRNLKSVHECSK